VLLELLLVEREKVLEAGGFLFGFVVEHAHDQGHLGLPHFILEFLLFLFVVRLDLPLQAGGLGPASGLIGLENEAFKL
jgi:hypothetical protein